MSHLACWCCLHLPECRGLITRWCNFLPWLDELDSILISSACQCLSCKLIQSACTTSWLWLFMVNYNVFVWLINLHLIKLRGKSFPSRVCIHLHFWECVVTIRLWSLLSLFLVSLSRSLWTCCFSVAPALSDSSFVRQFKSWWVT